jgi:hypothetical protein
VIPIACPVRDASIHVSSISCWEVALLPLVLVDSFACTGGGLAKQRKPLAISNGRAKEGAMPWLPTETSFSRWLDRRSGQAAGAIGSR